MHSGNQDKFFTWEFDRIQNRVIEAMNKKNARQKGKKKIGLDKTKREKYIFAESTLKGVFGLT